MTNTEQRIQALIEMLSRDARTNEDRTRAEAMRRNWTELQDQRLRDDLKVLLMTEARRYEDEQFEAALDDVEGGVGRGRSQGASIAGRCHPARRRAIVGKDSNATTQRPCANRMAPIVGLPPTDGLQGTADPRRWVLLDAPISRYRAGTTGTKRGHGTERHSGYTGGGGRTCDPHAETIVTPITNFRRFYRIFHSMAIFRRRRQHEKRRNSFQ
jgi:hypothetical protein